MTYPRAFLLCLLLNVIVSPPAHGDVFQPASGAGTFGTPYGYLGLDGRKSWEVYRKMNGDAVVTATPVSGNGTQAEFTNQHLGDVAGSYNFTGEVLLGKTQSTTLATDMVYLKDMTLNNGATTPPSGGYDANLHTGFDLRIGFVQNASAYMTAKGGDNKDNDLFGELRGTNGVYFHLGGGNTGATIQGQPGNAWNVGPNGPGGYLFGPLSLSENLLVPTTVNRTLITSGGTPVDNGAAYNAPLEISAKMMADPLTPGNVIAQAKAGNNLYQFSFNPSDLSFTGTFDWQHATPIIFVGKSAFDSFNPASAHLGILAPGDADADGTVGFSDLVAVAQNYGSSADPSWSTGDLNGDGAVNFADLVAVAQHYGQTASGPPAAASDVPEPASLALAGVFACIALGMRRRASIEI